MTARAELLLPPAALAGCVAAEVFRDTLGVDMPDRDRLNYFPASPLFSVTRVFEGQLHVAQGLADIPTLRQQVPDPALVARPPNAEPICSWSAGSVRALTIGFYPEAWIRLGGVPEGGHVPEPVAALMHGEWDDAPASWAVFCADLQPLWGACRGDSALQWAGSHRLADWVRHVAKAAALSGTGQSLRSAERRFRRWTGQTRQGVDLFAKVEDLYARRVDDPAAPLAELAADAGFSDQSHMGRAVKRVTGFSPARLNQLIETEEAFWCYRLMGERF
ncbi:helix-turn-helix domain-containing protein [uncultured Tateyamaria sp.]|uniref:helix-turn-helix domain-containing protein n=1 Tax=uncultured Tateyamaria sp. TaxID=455651 RepID=UPI002623B117|nr:helix-turn-helix domain-containing protein [uncultured Tateyamaria sp.]